MIELFAKKVNNVNLKPSTILGKKTILDVSGGPECSSTGGYN